MRTRLLRATAILIAGLGGACDQGPATQPLGPRSPATWSSMIHAGRDGPIWLDVQGDPFGGGADSLGVAVAAALEGAVVLERPFLFSADRAAAARPEFRAVMAFAPERIVDADAACAGSLRPAVAGPPPTLHVLVAFCDRAAVMAAVTGWVKDVAGPQDRRFRDLVGQAARELFRPDRPRG